MTKEEIRAIVQQVLAEERRNNDDELDVTVLKTVSGLLTSFGIPDDERKDIAEDFRYLRRWRLGAERVQGLGMTAIVALIVGGIASALWLGIKAAIGK